MQLLGSRRGDDSSRFWVDATFFWFLVDTTFSGPRQTQAVTYILVDATFKVSTRRWFQSIFSRCIFFFRSWADPDSQQAPNTVKELSHN
jgi:hypothetical protein